MYKSIYLARRNPSLTAAQFHERWREHSALTGTTQRIRPYFTQVVQCARLDGSGLDDATTEFDGANLLGLVNREAGAAVFDEPEHRDIMLPDELLTFSGPIRDCTLVTRESVCKAGGFSRYLILRFLKFRTRGDRESQFARWTALQSAGDRQGVAADMVRRSVANLVVDPAPSALDFDVVAETWFSDVEELQRHSDDQDEQARLAGAIEELCEAENAITFVARVNHSRPPIEGRRAKEHVPSAWPVNAASRLLGVACDHHKDDMWARSVLGHSEAQRASITGFGSTRRQHR